MRRAVRSLAVLALAVAVPLSSGCILEFPADPVPEDVGPPDARPDVGPPPPTPCAFDQDRPEGAGCPKGFVCNLKTQRCVPGRECASDADCLVCSAAARRPGGDPGDACHHGFAVTSWCDVRHHPEPDSGLGICTRTRSPCERCIEDADCGKLNDDLELPPGFGDGPLAVECVDYGDGPEDRFCSRPCNPFDFDVLPCPLGFKCDADGLSIRDGRCIQGEERCERTPVFCPAPADDPDSVVQISPPARCPGGGLCQTNDRPGATGLCLGACRSDEDCNEPAKPVCNVGNGLCVPDCRGGAVACEERPEQPQVCHPLIGLCALSCYENEDTFQEADAFCERTYGEVYGDVYCNVRNRSTDGRYWKRYYPEGSCVRRGCELGPNGETGPECPIETFCDVGANDYPRCHPGCRTADDCGPDLTCRDGEPGSVETPADCARLDLFDPPDGDPSAHGICCLADK